MKLKTLLKEIPRLTIKGPKEIDITGITSHAQTVAPGDLFVAKKGMTRDGSAFIPMAVGGGARAVLTAVYNPFLQGVTQVIHPDPGALEPLLASRFFASPSDALFLVGVTGTSGKTTTGYLIHHLLDKLRVPSGLIGTVEWRVGKKILPSQMTTPDLLTTQKLLREMVDSGSKGAVMEVSSHALEQRRVEGLAFDGAVFTNFTQDHLDFHGTMEAYAKAKAKLFAMTKKWAVINTDDPHAPAITAPFQGRRLTYGIDSPADLTARDIHLSPQGISASLNFSRQEALLATPLIGRFNLYNCLAAIGVGLCFGATLKEAVRALRAFTSVPGRMERVPHPSGIDIFVDYAHKEDALKNALLTLRAFAPKRLITLFGCGGDRDRDKRPRMGRVAESLSDLIVITSDNPRSEDPEKIIQEIASGLQQREKAHIEVDRKRAIEWAIAHARPGDILLIAGKGHETYQIFADRTIHFDDRLILAGAPSRSREDLN